MTTAKLWLEDDERLGMFPTRSQTSVEEYKSSPAISQRRALEEYAARTWAKTYKLGAGDPETWDWIAHDLAEEDREDRWIAKLFWGVKWLDSGKVLLQCSHTFAAALMATKVHPEMGEDVIVPWRAFAVELPADLLRNDQIIFRRVEVMVPDGVASSIRLEGERIGPKPGVVEPIRLSQYDGPADLLFSEEESGDDVEWSIHAPVADAEFKARCLRLARRLVVGLLCTMQHTNNFRDRGPVKTGKKLGPRNPPPHRNIFVGKPLAVDVRPAIKRYLEGSKGAPPSVQTLVRGHYKRQVIGIGRTGRKVIWVEPYWRGPEDAPILSRPYHVGGKA